MEEREIVRCWVEKSTKEKDSFGENLVKHQREGFSEERGELEKKEV